MSKLDPKMVREWRAGYLEANRLDLEEARARTPAERLQNLQRFLCGIQAMGLLREREDDLEYHLRWQKAREKWLERHS